MKLWARIRTLCTRVSHCFARNGSIICPQALAVELSNMNNSDLCMFLLSGFHSPNIIREWDMVYVNICKFIIAIYEHKVSLILS